MTRRHKIASAANYERRPNASEEYFSVYPSHDGENALLQKKCRRTKRSECVGYIHWWCIGQQNGFVDGLEKVSVLPLAEGFDTIEAYLVGIGRSPSRSCKPTLK